MSTAESTTDEKDFYTQLMIDIEAGNINTTVEMFMALEAHHSQLEILTHLTSILDSTLNIRGVNTLDLDRARALLRARDRALELTYHLDLVHAHALETALDRARALYLNLDRATLINRAIIACLSAMDDGKLDSSSNAQATLSPSKALQSALGKIITATLLCTLMGIALTSWMVLLRG